MRALVISDTHFGAWTGQDILRDADTLALLAPHLDGLDEVIFLGDLFDLLFARLEDAFAAAGGLLELLREKLQGRRLVFLPGNHDHHFVLREQEALRELRLATDGPVDPADRRLGDALLFRRFLARRLEGVEVQVRYPTYTFGRVLCTHGHYLDPHARGTGSLVDRLLGHAIWSIALGGRVVDPRTVDDYESTITLLTEELYTLAQLPHGTAAQRNVYAAVRRIGAAARAAGAPARVTGHALRRLRGAPQYGRRPGEARAVAPYLSARAGERDRRATSGAPVAHAASPAYPLVRLVRPSDPREQALAAFAQVVETLGWGRETDQIVFAHTHQPLEDVRAPGSPVRYWNTGSWIYEPDLSSPAAYRGYLRRAWPGTAVLIDTDEPAPRLLRLREHLNPLYGDGSGGARPDLRPGAGG